MLLLLTHRLHCCMEYIGSSTISIIDRMILYISNHVTALWNLMGFSTRQAADQPSNYTSVPTQNTQASMQERSITSTRTSVSREHAACDLGSGDGLNYQSQAPGKSKAATALTPTTNTLQLTAAQIR